MRILRAAAAVLALIGAVMNPAEAKSHGHNAVKSNDYVSSDPSVGLRAFIYADHTVVQLDSYKVALQIVDDSGGTIGYTLDGRFANVAGRLNHFVAFVNGQRVEFTRPGWTQPRAAAAPASIATALTLDAGESEIAAPAPVRTPKTASAATKQSSNVAPSAAPKVDTPAAPVSQNAKVGETPAAVPAAVAKSPLAASATPSVATASAASAPLVGTSSSSPSTTGSTPGVWTIREGYPIGQELQSWAKRVGWKVVWRYPVDRTSPNTATFTCDFPTAANQVIQTLAENGLDILCDGWSENRTFVVTQRGATDQ